MTISLVVACKDHFYVVSGSLSRETKEFFEYLDSLDTCPTERYLLYLP